MEKRKKRRRAPREGALATSPREHRRAARIYREICVNGSRFWALFDSGARRTYVTVPVARLAGAKRLPYPIKCALGGATHTIRRFCALAGTVEGYGITADALVVDKLFPDERGRPIVIIIGMETMETWGIGLDTTHKRLDFTFYAREVYEG